MKVIFLDIDGVLNNWTRMRAGHTSWPVDSRDEDTLRDTSNFDPASIAALSHILRNSGASVVISSSWRRSNDSRNRGEFNALFRAYGLPEVVIGGTPFLLTQRGDEIDAWLASNPVEGWAIIDDDDDMMDDQMDHLCHVDGKFGLGRQHISVVQRILKLPA